MVGKLLPAEKANGEVATIEGRPKAILGRAFATTQVDLLIRSRVVTYNSLQKRLISAVLKWAVRMNQGVNGDCMMDEKELLVGCRDERRLEPNEASTSTVFCFLGFACFPLTQNQNLVICT